MNKDLFAPPSDSELAQLSQPQTYADDLFAPPTRAELGDGPGKIESMLRGAAQGVTFGFADEITGAVSSLLSDKSYQEARDASRANYDAAREANPGYFIGSEIAGGIATTVVPGAKLLNVGRGARLGNVAAKSAAGAGLYGLGASDADLTEGEFGDAVKDAGAAAAIGGVAGPVLHKALPVAGKAVKAAGKGVAKGIRGVGDRMAISGAPDEKAAVQLREILKSPKRIKAAAGKPEAPTLSEAKETIRSFTNQVEDIQGLTQRGLRRQASIENRMQHAVDDYMSSLKAADDVVQGALSEVSDPARKMFYSPATKKALEKAVKVLRDEDPRAVTGLREKITKLGKEYDQLESQLRTLHEKGNLSKSEAVREKLLGNKLQKIDNDIIQADIETANHLTRVKQYVDDALNYGKDLGAVADDENLLRSVRQQVDNILKETTPGREQITQADAIYRNFQEEAKPFLKMFEGRDVGGLSDSKVQKFMRGAAGAERATRQEREDMLRDYLLKSREQGGLGLAEGHVDSMIGKLNKPFQDLRDQQLLNEIGARTGSTTGRSLGGVIVGTHVGGMLTGGPLGAILGAIAGPIVGAKTNPKAYVQAVAKAQSFIDKYGKKVASEAFGDAWGAVEQAVIRQRSGEMVREPQETTQEVRRKAVEEYLRGNSVH